MHLWKWTLIRMPGTQKVDSESSCALSCFSWSKPKLHPIEKGEAQLMLDWNSSSAWRGLGLGKVATHGVFWFHTPSWPTSCTFCRRATMLVLSFCSFSSVSFSFLSELRRFSSQALARASARVWYELHRFCRPTSYCLKYSFCRRQNTSDDMSRKSTEWQENSQLVEESSYLYPITKHH